MPVIVTFSRADSESDLPLENGPCRSEEVTVGQVSTLAANSGDNVATLLADEDCWVSIGAASALAADDANAGSNRRPIKSGVIYNFRVKSGWKIGTATRS